MSNDAITAPSWVHAVDLGEMVVVVDTRLNRLEVLLGDARSIWAALASTGSPQGAAYLAGLPLRRVARLISYLTGRELLTATTVPTPWPKPTSAVPRAASWGTREYPAQLSGSRRVPWMWWTRAAIALGVTLTVQRTGRHSRQFIRVVNLASLTGRRARPATVGEARRAVSAVRHVGRFVPARVACFEESIAAAVTLALVGRQATWCHGVASDPLRFHAWLTVDAQPIEEPETTGEYTVLLRIGPLNGDRKGQP